MTMNELVEMMNKVSQTSVENARRLAEINLRAGERMLEEQMALANVALETGVKSLELMGKAKGYQELANGQAELAREYGQRLMQSYKTGAEVMAEAREALTAMVDEGVKAASENLKQAASKKAA
jgi:hypothetical protein